MKATFRTVTPADASEWLDGSDMNRPVSQVAVDSYARQMKAGAWACNGEPIILNGRKVLDGQHRLWAVVESGVPIEVLVVEGVPDKAFDTIDTGRMRSKADMVDITAKRHDMALSTAIERALASAINYIVLFDANGYYSENNRARPTNRDIVRYMQANMRIVDEVQTLSKLGRSPVPLSILTAIYHLVLPKFPKCLEAFFAPLVSGAGLASGSPILTLRSIASQFPRPHYFVRSRDQLAITIKAWNAHAANAMPKVLRFSPGTESFPTLAVSPGARPTGKKG